MPERRPSGFFVLRVPVLPVDVFTGWSEGLSAPGAADLEGAVAQDRTTLRARLRSWVERPGTREAVHLASPDLEGSIDAC